MKENDLEDAVTALKNAEESILKIGKTVPVAYAEEFSLKIKKTAGLLGCDERVRSVYSWTFLVRDGSFLEREIIYRCASDS